MSERVRIARVDEVPPGEGKVVLVGGVEVKVWNVEGRFLAERASGGPGAAQCTSGGRHFRAAVEDSPARLRDGLAELRAEVEGDFVVVELPG